MRTIRLAREQIYSGPLLLINRAHPMRPGTPAVLCPVDKRQPEILLEKQAAQMLCACFQRVGGEGRIVPVSGYRSYGEQQRIWDETLAESGEAFTRRYVARPGCSEHQTGLAIDLGQAASQIDFIRPAFPYHGLCGEFRRMAPRYGFIERYPRGKEAVTGIGHEPWHFRYVGIPHAMLITENGLCLEEYRDFLGQSPRSYRLEQGRLAQAFYVPATGDITEVEVPEGCCRVSGDNAGGFIVTVWGGSL